jgi:hypothetical protein
MDAEAQTVDGTSPHPLVGRIDETLLGLPWVDAARSRVRDQGHVFHVESFVVPRHGTVPTFTELGQAREAVAALDWKVQDLVLAVVPELPDDQLPGLGELPR